MVLKWLKLCNDNSLNREMVSGALCHSQKTQAGAYNPIEIL